MKIFTSILALILCSSLLQAQTTLSGQVVDDNAKPLAYATVALLEPADSTLAFFGITNHNGYFEVKKIKAGNYLLQVAFIGHGTYYKPLDMPAQAGDYGIVVLNTNPIDLAGAEIRGEYVPIQIKKDTVEYNAGAFKIKPNAVAEDLLRKLPGVEVDRDGNIKAMGEDVKKVMVDGKEFFSSDPKVATKNLPADAIDKVQVYDKKSEAAELAGIEDGSRDKTINLLLKDGKKEAWLGEVQAGAGTGEHFATSAKVYRFTPKNQFALLGMFNNINRFGFSFRDYIDFSGGRAAMMSGGSFKFTINSDSDLPINFGQVVNGLVQSGAGGLNFSLEPVKNNQLNISYLGNGSKRDLQQSIATRNYLPSGEFNEEETNDEQSLNFSHSLNASWKDKSDSARTLVFSGSLRMSNASENAHSVARAFTSGNLINELLSTANLDSDNVNGNGSFSAMFRGQGAFKLYSMGVNASFNKSINANWRINDTRYFDQAIIDNQFRDVNNSASNYGLSTSTLIRIGKGFYMEPQVKASRSTDDLDRTQGFNGNGHHPIDSLSPYFQRVSSRVTPGINFRYNIKKSKLVLGLSSLYALSKNELNRASSFSSTYQRLLPAFSWELDYKAGHRLSLNYDVAVEEPKLSLLLPIIDNSNPRSLFIGNRKLKPETRHNLALHWLLFDQFSSTSVFTSLNGTYTADKIGYSRFISDSLIQTVHLLNVDDDYSAGGRIEFSTPLRFIGLVINLSASGKYSQGLTFVNNERNNTTNLSRTFRLSFTNRKTKHWNLDFGGEVTVTDASYSIQQSLDNRYLNYNYFGTIEYNPTDSWHFNIKADVVNYSSKSFDNVTVPLLSAEVSYSMLKNKKGTIMLESYDLLDQNSGINRVAEMNYLRETRSNNMGRYVMASFKYKI